MPRQRRPPILPPTGISYPPAGMTPRPCCPNDGGFRGDVRSKAMSGKIILPIAGHSIAPWVYVEFKNSDYWVTVGNDSSSDSQRAGLCKSFGGSSGDPGPNHSIITNFTYGCSGGSVNGSDGITVEITDEEGGDFCNFMINILPKNRNEGKPASMCTMYFQFGWTVVDCHGNHTCIRSRKRKVYPLKMDVAFQGGGVIKFTINACNPAEVIAEGENTKNTVYKQVDLKTAIKTMFQEQNMDAMFLRNMPGGEKCCDGGGGGALTKCATNIECTAYDTWKMAKEPDGGNTTNWQTNQKDPISAAMGWLQNKRTRSEPNRGFIVGTCNLASKPVTIVFWESPLPDCEGKSNIRNIGTFVVNGGKCSPVLEFKPQIQWHVANINQGGTPAGETTGAGKALTAQTFPEITCGVTGKGTNQVNQVPIFNSDFHSKDAPEYTAKSLAANARAMPPMEPIKAELTVQGMPELDDPMALCAGVECAIVVVNPYILKKRGSSECPDWLAEPPVNRFLSNKHWLINGVSHQIKEGSFTTTLHVWLAVPGVTLNTGAKLGGPEGPDVKAGM